MRQTVLLWVLVTAALVALILLTGFIFAWSQSAGAAWTVLLTVVLGVILKESLYWVRPDTTLFPFEFSTPKTPYVSGAYVKLEGGLPPDTRRGLFGTDIVFLLYPFWRGVFWPTKELVIHIDAVPVVTKDIPPDPERGIKGSPSTLVFVDTTLYVVLTHRALRPLMRLGILAEHKLGRQDFAAKTKIKYLGVNSTKMTVEEMDYYEACLAATIAKGAQNQVHDEYRSVAGEHSFEDIVANKQAIGEAVETRLKEDDQGFLYQTGIIPTEEDDENSATRALRLESELVGFQQELREAMDDARVQAIQGEGLRRRIEEAARSGVSPQLAIAEAALEKLRDNKITLISTRGGVMDSLLDLLGRDRDTE